MTKLVQHSEGKKHRDKIKYAGTQPTLSNFVGQYSAEAKKQIEVKEAAKKLEISLARLFSRHQMSPSHLGCLVDVLKESLSDSEIIKHVSLSETKGSYTILAIAKTYLQETIQLIKESDAVSVGFDESEMNKREEMEIVVKMSHPKHGILTRHFKTVELDHADAEYLKDTLLGQFTQEGINLEQLLISLMTDGTNVMIGNLSGVIKRVMDEYRGVHLMGSCLDHHLNNSLKAAVTEFDPDLEKAMVHLYEDIAGAKGRSQKSRKEFHRISVEECGKLPVPVAKFVSTRFRSIRHCVYSCLKNFQAIYSFYSQLKKPTPRQKNLQKYFVEQSQMTKLKLLFVQFASKDINEAIDFFEEAENHAHEIHSRMEFLLTRQMKKFLKDSSVQRVDKEGNMEPFSGIELLEVDTEDKSKLRSKKALKIGEECNKFIDDLGLNPASLQLSWFFKSVEKFHQRVAIRYQKYFKTGLESRELHYMSALSPKARTQATTELRLRFLSRSYSKVVKNIQLIGGQDMLDSEMEQYAIDTELDEFKDNEYCKYWEKVGQVQENGWPKYEILPRFASALGSQLNSNSECERKFSDQTKLSSDKSKNRMSQDMFDGHMQVKSGVESKLSRIGCPQCCIVSRREEIGIETTKDHCHCSFAPISEEMFENCKNASKEYKEELERNRKLKAGKEKLNEEKIASRKKQDEDLFAKLKSAVHKRSTFLAPDKMLRIWETDAEAKERKKVQDKVKEVPAKEKKKVQDRVKEVPAKERNKVQDKVNAVPAKERNKVQAKVKEVPAKETNKVQDKMRQVPAYAKATVGVGSAKRKENVSSFKDAKKKKTGSS